MIEYVARCEIQDEKITSAIQKYDATCIILEKKSLMLPQPYGFDIDTFGFGDDEYGFWYEEYRR